MRIYFATCGAEGFKGHQIMLVTRFVFETWALQPGYNSVIFKIKQSNTNYLQQLMWNSHCWWYAATLGAIMLISWCQQLLQWLLCNQLRLSRVQYRHFPHSASFQHSHDKCWHESACLTKNNHKAFWATVKAVQIKFCRSEKRQLLLGVALTLRKSALSIFIGILICGCVLFF